MNATYAEPAECTCFELREQDDVRVLELCGELGSLRWQLQRGVLEDTVLSALEEAPHPYVVVDLSGVRYAGAEFIEFLLGLRKWVHEAGGRLVLSGVQGNLRTMLRILQLDRILPRYPTADAAVHALRMLQR
jgi:anti-anti-sigma factor